MRPDDKLDALLTFVRADDRVCPRALEWQKFWESLPARRQTSAGWQPALPLVLAGWWGSTNQQKAERLSEHIVWAAQHGGLDAADAFLRGLTTECWHHSNPSKPNY
jgi:hypothetical protein